MYHNHSARPMISQPSTAGVAILEPLNLARTEARFFTLEKGQWLEIPQEPSMLRVLSGNVWIVVEQRDLVLSAGQEKYLPVGKYPAAVLVLGDVSVSVEIQSKTAPRLFL